MSAMARRKRSPVSRLLAVSPGGTTWVSDRTRNFIEPSNGFSQWSDVTAAQRRRMLCSGVIAEEAPESNAKTVSYGPAPCLATHPGDGYTAVVRRNHSSRSGIGPAPVQGGNKAG